MSEPGLTGSREIRLIALYAWNQALAIWPGRAFTAKSAVFNILDHGRNGALLDADRRESRSQRTGTSANWCDSHAATVSDAGGDDEGGLDGSNLARYAPSGNTRMPSKFTFSNPIGVM